ncbi:hypothetical protein C493_00955 [Natronolimnohabitans innermongolicus JCM 12255]|uniref:DUF7344 domain-containing protein n=1 Tax=Natronolimnohabitans innermongolicus JCM 12255 TaxID=1227499 RepID=L9XK82_9EURY|nr:hypothetical protein C493_00955 [Natronolimnohabitans innermongolicus JCM 12255]
MFSTLADSHRRLCCRHVAVTDATTVSIDELRTTLADASSAATEPDPNRAARIETRLRHVHLPMLDEAEVFEYDATQGTVQAGPLFPLATDLVEATADAPEVDAAMPVLE